MFSFQILCLLVFLSLNLLGSSKLSQIFGEKNLRSICDGTGRVDCFQCQGKVRTNCANLAMLPKGEWPKWCKTCGGSGLAHCSRCLGSGEFRDVMGFRFMKRDETSDSGCTYRNTNGSNFLRNE
ncbi:hypothetical protein MKX01_000737 [Papaver californicum]|nr:hypothetical protein MKX01_000737 [Papaver californicum]